MARLLLIRHGQASLLEEHYDKLSPLGREQSRLLGAFWAKRRVTFQQVFSGPAERHIRSAEIVAGVLVEQGLPWPEPVILPGLAEFDAEVVLKKAVPMLAERDEEIRRLRETFHEADGKQEAVAAFHKLFDAVIPRWVRGEFSLADVEPWEAFSRRVHGAIEQMTRATERGQRIAAFTSGGPIGIAMQRALKADLPTTLQLTSMNYNSAVTEFLFSGERFSLKSFNGTAHLTDPEHFTHW